MCWFEMTTRRPDADLVDGLSMSNTAAGDGAFCCEDCGGEPLTWVMGQHRSSLTSVTADAQAPSNAVRIATMLSGSAFLAAAAIGLYAAGFAAMPMALGTAATAGSGTGSTSGSHDATSASTFAAAFA